MGAPITLSKIFREEPYRSIVNLLFEYRKGLELKRIQYILFENHCLHDYTVSKIKEDLGVKYKDLIVSGKIKKYQMKQINRNKKGKNQDNTGIRTRNNLNNFLKKMMNPPNQVIYKENGKYKLYDSSIEQLILDSDKEYIDICSKKSKRNLLGGRINIYGYAPLNTAVFGLYFDEKKNVNRYNSAIKKLREGIDELQSLMDESIGWYLQYDVYWKYLLDDRYTPLDKELLQILHYYGIQSVKKDEKTPLETWLNFEDERLLIIPDKKLVDLFKKHFYPTKKTSHIKSMLKDHVINKEISSALLKMIYPLLLKQWSHIVAVIHSGSGYVIKQKELYKNLSKFPMFYNDANKRSNELSGSLEDYLTKYFNKQEDDLQEIKGQAIQEKPNSKNKLDKLTKQLNEKKIEDIDDWLNLHKNIMKISK